MLAIESNSGSTGRGLVVQRAQLRRGSNILPFYISFYSSETRMGSATPEHSSLKQFLASISTIKGDLSNITTPPFLLAPKSTVEFPATWCEHPSILVAPDSEPDPERRALLVLKWYLTALKRQQYQDGNDKEGVKKPLNAFLGELFLAEWNGQTGKTRLISEQVR